MRKINVKNLRINSKRKFESKPKIEMIESFYQKELLHDIEFKNY